jgi:hypothetical protein
VDRLRRPGSTGFILFSPTGGTPDSTSVTRFAREIAPAVREATASNTS